MVFRELFLENYGPYAGVQRLDLSPVSDDKPVILIGGMNGAGKTSILDAVLLVLFGKRADCAGRKQLSYGNFLKESTHRSRKGEVSSITLSFERWNAGKKEEVRVKREWIANGNLTKDKVTVEVNGKHSKFLSDSWDNVVESFIPFGVSHLFFFNGEKIREMADVKNSASIIRTATHTLLGIDLIDQLIADLHALERRKSLEAVPATQRDEIDSTREAISNKEDQLASKKEEIHTQHILIRRVQSRIESVNEKFLAEGGDLYSKRTEMEEEYEETLKDFEEVQEALRKLAADIYPLFLVSELLEEVSSQAEAEVEAKLQQRFLDELVLRDKEIISSFSSITGSEAEALASLLLEDRRERASALDVEAYLEAESQDAQSLYHILHRTLPEAHREAEKKLDEYEFLDQRLTSIDRALSAVPEAERIAAIIEERDELSQQLDHAQKFLEKLQEDTEKLTAEIDACQDALSSSIRGLIESDFENEDLHRVTHHSELARSILDRFRKDLVRRNISVIEQLSLESAAELFSKESLFSKLSIDPTDYTLTLHDDASDEPLCVAKLSEGERQLLAGSILWGLAKASDYPLPAIIDTPLGRLDSTHRRYLMESYFPNASHQVILLSTDEEVTEKNLKKLKPRISRMYYIDHDKKKKQSYIRTGYFPWIRVD